MKRLTVAITHMPWESRRTSAFRNMCRELPWGVSPRVHAFTEMHRPALEPWDKFKVRLALQQWQWAAVHTGCTHHLFLTDDLHLAPGFLEILDAMREAEPNRIVGLLSNHPDGPELFRDGHTSYTTNSWLVGPAYMLPHAVMLKFLRFYQEATPAWREAHDDDSALNYWITFHGPGVTWHPLPTIVEHRADIPSSRGHENEYSRERLSWRAERHVQHDEDGWHYCTEPFDADLVAMSSPDYWRGTGPFLSLPEKG